MSKTVSGILLILFLVGMVSLASKIQLANAQSTSIYIRSDGSISPSSAPISTVDNVTYTFTGNMSYPTYNGIVVERGNIVIDGNGYFLQGNYSGNGISLMGISNVTIENANILAFQYGIYLSGSNNNTVSGNNATANGDGVVLDSSSNNVVSGNNASAGIYLSIYSPNSNAASQAQAIAIPVGIDVVSSSNNTVSGNIATANGIGIHLYSSSNNVVSGNNVTMATNSGVGIDLEDSSYNILSGNYASENGVGIKLQSSSNNNTVSGNTATANSAGIGLDPSSNNVVSGNNVTANSLYGIFLYSSSNNEIYHNNFVNNKLQVNTSNSTNVWDNGYPSGGNYWSDYNGTDLYDGLYQNITGSDGIGDTPYVIDANNTDYYPLMGTFSTFNLSPYGNSGNVTVISNSTISNLGLGIWLSSPGILQPGQSFIYFSATGEEGSVGFCRLMFPATILHNSSSYVVYVDSQPVNATELPISNNTYVYLYFTYTQTTSSSITVTYVIPEFSTLILAMFMLATPLTIIIYRNRQLQRASSEPDRQRRHRWHSLRH